jgi:spermidine synthase
MELWYTEEWTDTIRFSIKVTAHVYTEKTPFQQIDIFDSEEMGRFMTLDGLLMLTEKDEFIYHEMMVHPAMAVSPETRNVLVIGAGDGGTVRELTRYPDIQRIDMVEIDQRVVEACRRYLPFTAAKLDDSRVHLIFEDGVTFVTEAPAHAYDLIIVDSTDPIGPGEGLFSAAFYAHCHRILNDHGILVNQNESPYFDSTAKETQRAYAKIRGLFPLTYVYQAHIPSYASGHWLFGFGSKTLHPFQDVRFHHWQALNIPTKYYNPALHAGAFALPNYVRALLEASN